MYKIGEALVGKGNEVAHIDLMIGDKNGPVGQAFAQGAASLTKGHTPILAVMRPNLPTKPYTLIIPKVTLGNMGDVNKIFGPAQAAVAKAIADSVEEGVIPKEKIDDMVIIASVFVHPEASDYRKIYHFNYGATKLALSRALNDYPNWEKIAYDKDRATHPIMGFRVPRLWNPPYLQVAIDVDSAEKVKKVIAQLPKSDRILIELGTPTIKACGLGIIGELRATIPEVFVIADTKTMDVGQVEVDMAFNETADAISLAGAGPIDTVEKGIYEARRMGICSIIDMINVSDPIKLLKSLKQLPDVIELHRAIDAEGKQKPPWDQIPKIKAEFADKKMLIAVAGGITPETAPDALAKKADIIVVGRYITQSKDLPQTVREFLKIVGGDIDQMRAHIE